jgi:pimeloyl-ACP methyl ester carboxylesterase
MIPARKSWAQHYYNIVRWKEMPKGGHFAALEQPNLLAQEIIEFVKQVNG